MRQDLLELVLGVQVQEQVLEQVLGLALVQALGQDLEMARVTDRQSICSSELEFEGRSPL